MKRILPLIALIIASALHADAQFLDQFEKVLDRLTGYEEPESAARTLTGNPYGANPGMTLTCSKAGVKGDMGYLLLTLTAAGDSIRGVRVSASGPQPGVRFNTPQVADSAAVFVVSPAYVPCDKKKKGKAEEMYNVATPEADISIPAGEAVDLMVAYYGFPKKEKSIGRFDIQMTQDDAKGATRYFGFTLDNVPLRRTRK